MKKITKILVALAAMVCMGFSANASVADDWKEKMMAEKIAFLTLEVGLTPEEAQAFWPVYNQISKEKNDAQKAGEQITASHSGAPSGDFDVAASYDADIAKL